MTCTYDCYTDVGGRENNEDSVLAVGSRGRYLFVVADGLGGHECGEVASRIAVTEMKRQFNDASTPFDPVRAVCDANMLILKEQARTGKKMKTTVVLAYVEGDRTVLAHVGDSRGYLMNENRIVFQTLDHSASQLAVSVGEITPSQIRHHIDRNVLLRALGAVENLKVDTTEFSNDSIDSILLCTDGFWEYVLEEDMLETLEQSAQPGKWLCKMKEIHDKRVPKKHDNHTAVAAFLRGAKK